MEIVYKKVLEPKEAVYRDYKFDCKKLNEFLKNNSIKTLQPSS